MCGIAGKVNWHAGEVSHDDIARMNKAIAHRGPDGTGIYISDDRHVGLGHTRLAVMDTSERGRQPMAYIDRYHIVFNGEIYNFRQERVQLEKEGYRFTSNTDTEVILALYDKYGAQCVERLDGMFAFALYDKKKHTLFCARDRLGKKPFKYYHNSSVFIFASELKAILTQPEYKRSIDEPSIYHYLTLQYTLSPSTGFSGISKLPPAHTLHLDIRSGRVTTHRYWQLDFRRKQSKSVAAWKQEVVDGLERAVQKRLIADVPLGAFLSGGIDSSAIVAFMVRHTSQPVRTFSIGFADKRFNELSYARIVARHFKTDHTEFVVNPTDVEILPQITRQFEEPFADSSALPMWHLAQETRRHVTVALGGDGGDESFAGYPKYSIQAFALAYERLRPLHTILVKPIADMLYDHVRGQFLERAMRFARTASDDFAHRLPAYTAFFTEEQKQSALTNKFAAQIPTGNTYDLIAGIIQNAPAGHPLEKVMYADITTWLPDDLLVKGDIASMAFGLEVRSPFLDHTFMEGMATMPANLKLRGITGHKYILKAALASYLPRKIIRRPKRGFSIPLSVWLRGDFHAYAAKNLLAKDARIHEYVRQRAIADILHDHRHGKRNYAHHIWAILMLELWLQEYF